MCTHAHEHILQLALSGGEFSEMESTFLVWYVMEFKLTIYRFSVHVEISLCIHLFYVCMYVYMYIYVYIQHIIIRIYMLNQCAWL